MKNNKVLFIGPFPEPITGMSLANKVLFDSLNKKGYKVDLINTSLYSFEESVGNFSIKKLFFFLKFNLYLYKILRVKTIYITPGSTFFGVAKYLLFFMFSYLLKKRIVVHIHTNNLQSEYNKISYFKKRFVKFILSKSSFGIVLSPSLKNNLLPFLQDEKIFIVNNFIENQIISKQTTIENKKIDCLRIVFLSNLMTKKGIFLLLEALKNLEGDLNYKINLAGYIDNSVKDEVTSKIKSLKNATYLGVVRDDDKKRLLEWGNVFVFPSYLTEGLPLSILEAFATGNYIISTEHPSLIDFFDNGSIHFIEKKSVKSIENALKEVVNNFDVNKLLKNQQNVKANFTVENFTNSIITIFNK